MAGQPLPNLTTVDIEVARIKRNNLLYKQKVEAQRARTTISPDMGKTSGGTGLDLSQEAYRLRTQLKPPINGLASPIKANDPNYRPPSIDQRVAQLKAQGYKPLPTPELLRGSSPDRVNLRSSPSSGNLPPTPRTGGQVPLPNYEPQSIRTAAPRQPMFKIPKVLTEPLPFAVPKINIGTLDVLPLPKKPSSLPQLPIKGIPKALGAVGEVAGKAALPLGAGIDAYNRAQQGQNTGQILGGVAGGVAGAIAGGEAGAAAGAAAGALLGPVGAAVGGVIGGLLGGAIGGLTGGGIADQLTGANDARPGGAEVGSPHPPNGTVKPFSGGQSSTLYRVTVYYRMAGATSEVGDTATYTLYGPIRGAQKDESAAGTGLYILHSNPDGSPARQVVAATDAPVPNATISIKDIVRLDGAPDTGGDPDGSPAPGPQGSPMGGGLLLLDGPPSSGIPATDGQGRPNPNRNGAPNPAPSSTPAGGSPRGDSPYWVSSGGPAPGQAPGAGIDPQPLGPGLPETGGRSAPGSSRSADRPTSGSGRQSNPWLVPGLLVGAAAGGLALAPTIRGRNRPDSRKRNSPFKQLDPPDFNFSENSCSIDPCMAGLQRQSQSTNEQVGSIDKRLAALQTGAGLVGEGASTAAILARLDEINLKLGPQIANGGIGNFVKKTWDFLQIDRVLAVFTFITTLHNAYNLSSGLTQTLFSALSNSLAVFGVDDANDQPLDINAIASKWTDQFFKSIFGVQEVDGFKASWRKFNNIFRTAANVVSSVQSLFYSVQSILEVLGQNISKIGNALKAWGAVSDRAYGWMSEATGKPGILGAFDRVRDKTQAIEEITSNIDGVASEVLGARETLAEFEKQTEEVQTLVQNGVPKPQIENLPIKQAQAAQKAVSQSPPITSADLVKPEV